MTCTEPLLVEKFVFRGLNGRRGWCRLELLRASDGRTVAIATELADNPGTSVTNASEYLASNVCSKFGVDPRSLVWIEHYGYGNRQVRTYDLVTFSERPKERIRWSGSVLRYHPDGWPGYFADPVWRPMCVRDWQELGLAPRLPVRY